MLGLQTITQKMADQVWFDFHVVFTMSPLRSLIVKEVELCDLTLDCFQIENRNSVKPFEAVL